MLRLAAGLLSALVPVMAPCGSVIDRDGRPIQDARVCYIKAGVDQACARTDENGTYDLPASDSSMLRVAAEDYMPKVLAAADQAAPIVLEKTPVLFVQLVDAQSGEPLGQGSVQVIYPSGESRGPFPANAAGVRVQRVLQPGQVRLHVEADGFTQEHLEAAVLKAGQETKVVVKLTRLPTANR